MVLCGGAGADERPAAAAAKQAFEDYLARIDEIERIAANQKAEAKERLKKALQSPEQSEAPSGARFHGMLGSYFNQEGRIPFILLSVPNGENVFGEYARSVFNGKYDFTRSLTKFHAHGHIVIPKDGQYYLEASRGYGDFKLNGMGYSLGMDAPANRYGARVTLKQGVYEVEFSTNNNGGQLPEASIRILVEETKEELPIFVYESELKAFQSEISEGRELIETSKRTREENRLR